MSDLVTLSIDGIELAVPKGTLVVDAAKRIGKDIPVFCYHPKMTPVGMCRMCLVDVGMPVRDRQSGELVLGEDGNPEIRFAPVLQTGCTVEVAPGMVVRTNTDKVTDARGDIIEFLLTSHPLDCPICDKGGECPLQNLTIRHGKDSSRFDFDDKLHSAKNVPLGDLIFLDRERCIQCARCTRFQSEIVDDPVIAFHNRGRHLEIVTMSDPGFDSHWSGNTTDICPVGALTTADFRFGARPWEMTPVASICPHCPVGCNTTMSTRREAKSRGQKVIKRIMPRQNERVNEIWLCDKGRFVHHFADSEERLTKPLVRQNGDLVESSWEEALDLVAGRLQLAKGAVGGVASDRLSNEDLFMFQRLFRQGLESSNLDISNKLMGGSEIVAQVGITEDSNLKDLGPGDAILVVASDLHEEAPVWWLRAKQAAERGASLVVLNLRQTRLDKYAQLSIEYEQGEALSTVHKLLNASKVESEPSSEDPILAAADMLVKANNLVIFYGAEGLSFHETESLARMLGNLLLVKQMGNEGENQHAGRVNSGLIAVWPHANTQGAFDMGIRPDYGPGYGAEENPGLDAASMYAAAGNGDLEALYLVGADPVGDGQLEDRGSLTFLVVQELFMTKTAELADVVLPAQSWAEREGTYTSGERRVQRFYPAIPPIGESRPDWQIFSQVGEKVGLGRPSLAPSLVFRSIAETIAQYEGMDYRTLAWSEEQWPDVGGDDLYYGGTSYDNKSGLGLQWPVAAQTSPVSAFEHLDVFENEKDELAIVPVVSLYDSGTIIAKSPVISSRIAKPVVRIHTDEAKALSIANGDEVPLIYNGSSVLVTALVSDLTPRGVALIIGLARNAGPGVAQFASEKSD
ncbi:MAG TPA: NADH-quinone oxidoreductase subunit NuoG [candidate division Zixibacteria bacterium]|nr:NADH-quinone oxidoreductase subunit NuoG [candidate division Zixibacteria bacterium]